MICHLWENKLISFLLLPRSLRKSQMAQPRSQGLSSNRPLGRARRDPGLVWSRATLTIENIREGSSVIRQFVALSFVALRLTFISNSIYSGVYLKGLASLSRDNLPWS